MKFARCNSLTCQQMRTCFKAVHSEMWICPPRDNFGQQLVYHCSTYQITVRFHAFVILLIFFVPGQIQKSLALPHSSSKFWALWKDPIDCRHFLLSATCSELNILLGSLMEPLASWLFSLFFRWRIVTPSGNVVSVRRKHNLTVI